METNKKPKYKIPEYDPYTGEMNPYYIKSTKMKKELKPKTIPYPKPGEKYQHYKGGQYEIVCMCNHTDTNEMLVIYKSLSFGGFHARPYDEWHECVGTEMITTFEFPIYRFVKI
jgi:hypothetical protein